MSWARSMPSLLIEVERVGRALQPGTQRSRARHHRRARRYRQQPESSTLRQGTQIRATCLGAMASARLQPQRQHVEVIEEAKKPETRARRIERATRMIRLAIIDEEMANRN